MHRHPYPAQREQQCRPGPDPVGAVAERVAAQRHGEDPPAQRAARQRREGERVLAQVRSGAAGAQRIGGLRGYRRQ